MSFKHQIRIKATQTFVAAICLALPPAWCQTPESQQSDTCKVTILTLNDVYNIIPVDQGKRGGFARIMTVKKQVLEKSPHALMLLAGDTLSPSVESHTFKGKQMIAGWNALGLDYATFGNHEFDFGPEVLEQRIAESHFKWLCANAIDKRTGKVFANIEPYAIRDVDGIKVGIIGLVTVDTATGSKPGPNIVFLDPIATAKKYIPEMRARGAQIIVALTHLFMYQDKELAATMGIDATAGGHEHIVMQSVSHGDVILKAGSDARNLGKIDINFARKAGQVESIDWQLIPVTDQIKEDPEVARVVDQYESQLSSQLNDPFVTTTVQLNARQPDNDTVETNLGDLIADSYRAGTGAELCLFNGGSIRANQIYEPGQLTRRDILTILPFENPIVKVEVKGSIVRKALECGVSSIGTKISGRFPQVSGLKFSYDARKPVGSRVVTIEANGAPLDDNRLYTLATNGYVMSDGDGYSMFSGAKFVIKPDDGDSESLSFLNYLQKLKTVAPKTKGRITRIDQAN